MVAISELVVLCFVFCDGEGGLVGIDKGQSVGAQSKMKNEKPSQMKSRTLLPWS